MQEIVKYHNDLNKIKLPNFTELEQNILIGIVAKIKEQPSGDKIAFTTQELMAFSAKNLTNKKLTEIIDSFGNKFFKADFKVLLKRGDLIGEARINLFNEFVIWKYDLERCGDRAIGRIGELEKIELAVNPKFAYLVYELTKNFTRFELAEFIALSGKYTKTLYRLLKQYRQTGWVEFEFDEFKRILDIPECYRQIDIDQQILKPALRELTAERNLFDTKRIIFKNLKYTKIKKGGNRVVAIRFQWDKEQVQEELESQAEARIAENLKNNIPTNDDYNAKQEFENYKGVEVSFYDSKQKIINATVKDFEFELKRLFCYDKQQERDFYIPFESLQKANAWISERLQSIF